MKRIISVILAVSSIICYANFSVCAVETNTEIQSLGTTTIPNNTVRMYTYNLDVGEGLDGYGYRDTVTGEVKLLSAIDCIGKDFLSINLNSPNGYHLLQYRSGVTGINRNEVYHFDKTGGEYERLRIRLSDFITFLNENGTYTHTFEDGTSHIFDFSGNEDSKFSSSAFIMNGAAVTAVKPDSNGEIVFYASREIGVVPQFRCNVYLNTTTMNDGDIVSCKVRDGIKNNVSYLMMGNVNYDNDITIDDATFIQKYLSDQLYFDAISKRNADVNNDGLLTIDDVTYLQKYIAGYDVK